MEELQRELEATRQQHTASVLELTDKLQVAEARAEAADARVAALHAASSEQTAQMRGELEAAHKRLLRAEAAEAESRAACASGITALPTVALSAVRAGAPTAIALTLDAPIAGDGTEATELTQMAPSTAMTPRARKTPATAQPPGGVTAAEVRRCGGGSTSIRKGSPSVGRSVLPRARGRRRTHRHRTPRAPPRRPPRRRSAVPRLRPCKRISSASSRRRLPLLPQSLARSPLPPPPAHLPPPSHLPPPPPPRAPTHHTPHPPPCLQLLAQRREERRAPRARPAKTERRTSRHPNRARTCAYSRRGRSRSERPRSIDVAASDAATRRPAELGDAAAEAEPVTPRGRRRRSRRMRPRVSTRSARRPGRAARRGRAFTGLGAARELSVAVSREAEAWLQIRGCRRIDDESRASARCQARRAAESRATPRGS